MKRPEPSRLDKGKPDGKLSMVGGLADFHAFHRVEGLQGRLAEQFDHLETGKSVVYPLHAQLQLLIELAALGVERVFGLEMSGSPIGALFEYPGGRCGAVRGRALRPPGTVRLIRARSARATRGRASNGCRAFSGRISLRDYRIS